MLEPRRFPFFYGWWIVVVATIGVICSIPGQTVGVSVFTDSLLDATGMSRLSISHAYLAGTVCSGVLLPLGGSWLDRFGAQRVAAAACVGLGLTLLYLGQIDRVSEALSFGHSWIGVPLLVLGFFTLRFSGQGMLTMVSRTLIGRWFNRRRGLAAGISGLFVSFAFGSAPLVLDAWVGAAGWRGAWQQMAVVVTFGMGTLAWFFFHDHPESVGLSMDGEEPKTKKSLEPEQGKTRAEAIRTLGFWAVTAALASQAMIITGVTFHIVDIGAKVGLDRPEAVAIFLPMAVVSTTTGLIGGWLADRAPIKWLVWAMMSALTLGTLSATTLDTASWTVILGFGIGGGLFAPLSTVAFPRLFGRAHLGSIAGIEMMFIVLGSAMGPSLFAWSEDATGTYASAMYAALALPALACLLALGVKHVPVS